MVQVHHDQGLDQITIDSIAQPCPSGLDFHAALPARMKGIDLVLQRGHAIFTEKDRRLILSAMVLPCSTSKPSASRSCRRRTSTVSLVSPFSRPIVAMDVSCFSNTWINEATNSGGGSVRGKVENRIVDIAAVRRAFAWKACGPTSDHVLSSKRSYVT